MYIVAITNGLRAKHPALRWSAFPISVKSFSRRFSWNWFPFPAMIISIRNSRCHTHKIQKCIRILRTVPSSDWEPKIVSLIFFVFRFGFLKIPSNWLIWRVLFLFFQFPNLSNLLFSQKWWLDGFRHGILYSGTEME